MPQLRSFTGFASTPNVGSAFVGGAGVEQRQQESLLNAQTQREQLANQYAMAEMQAATQRAALAQKAMSDAQELEVQKAYQQSQLGLKAREIDLEQQGFDLKSEEASRQFMAQERMRQGVEAAIASGKDPREAFTTEFAKYGVQSGAPSGAFTEALKPPRGAAAIPQAIELPGAPGVKIFQSGPETWSKVGADASVPPELEKDVAPGYDRFGKQLVRQVESPELKSLREDRKRMLTFLDSDKMAPGRLAAAKAADTTKELSKTEKFLAKEYADKQKQLLDIEAKIAAFGTRAGSTGGTTNQIGRFKVIVN